ncbi:unnamed protein product [Allacma fusca]|uniref:Uncharacterized protein n=1 Tax=Allacma fusca TaxID=39272 RepID=A0A8J2P4Q6_9HEXA|nr:unnamed protein product [Allacma fusca]
MLDVLNQKKHFKIRTNKQKTPEIRHTIRDTHLTVSLPLRCLGCRRRLDEGIPTDPELASLQILYMTCTSCRTKFDYLRTAQDAMKKQEKINLELDPNYNSATCEVEVSNRTIISRIKFLLGLIFQGAFRNWDSKVMQRKGDSSVPQMEQV